MKVVLALALAAIALVVVSAKSCKESDDCDDGQCCVGFTPFRGSCRSLSKQGRKCLVDERVFPYNEIYILTCPCEEGLECVGKEKNGEMKNDGACRVLTTEAPATTPKGSDETTGPGEVTSDGTNEVTDDGANEVTDDGDNEVTDGGDNEVTDDGANEVTDDGTNEATDDGSNQDDATEAPVEEKRRRR